MAMSPAGDISAWGTKLTKKTDINNTVLQEVVVGVRYVISVFFINTAN